MLALTSALLITLDLQGNSAVGSLRRGFGVVFSPIEDATRVVTRPVENAWHGIRDYPDLAAENERLRRELQEHEATYIAAAATYQDAQELLAVSGLDSLEGITSVAAQVLGPSPSNIDQTVTINKGSDDGLKIGYPVVLGPALIGKITSVQADRSVVMLASDPQYSVAVKVENPQVPNDCTSTAGITPETTSTTTTLPPETSSPDSSVPSSEAEETSTSSTAPADADPTQTTQPPAVSPLDPPASPPTETTIDLDDQEPRLTGSLQGRGGGKNPYVERVSDTPRLGSAQVCAVVRTSGGENAGIGGSSLAPAGLVLGTVTKVIEPAGSGGDLLEVDLAVDLTTVDIVAVLQYEPEGPGG